jgi:hypothetical protein
MLREGKWQNNNLVVGIQRQRQGKSTEHRDSTNAQRLQTDDIDMQEKTKHNNKINNKN